MRAALTTPPDRPVEIVHDIEIDEPGAGQIRVAVHHCGLCHSDVSIMNGSAPSPGPTVTGHEAAGVVSEVGPGVTRVAVGDRVLLTPVPPCNACPFCLAGEHSLCVNCESIATGAFTDGSTGLRRSGEQVYRGLGLGAFADEVICLAEAAVPVPDDLDLADVAVVGCAVQTGVGSVINIARVQPGENVLVMGLGGVGMSIVQGARLAGAARIIVSDPVSERRDMAQRFGATDAIDPTSADVIAEVRALTGGIGTEHAFDAAGSAALIQTGFESVRNGGTVVLVGYAPLDQDLGGILPALLMYSQKRLVGSVLGGVNSHRDIPRLLELYRHGQLDLTSLVTRRRPLDDLGAAVDDLEAARGVRTILDLI